jgi:hypothetical protein
MSAWDGSCYVVERALKSALKDPDSYQHMETVGPVADGAYWKVRTRYRAKNSFGGYVIETKTFFIQQGRVVKVEDSGD